MGKIVKGTLSTVGSHSEFIWIDFFRNLSL